MTGAQQVLICYVQRSGLGLDKKLQTLVAGFSAAGCQVSVRVLNAASSPLHRAWGWLRLQAGVIGALLTGRYDVVFIRYTYQFLPIFVAARLLGRKLHVEANSDSQNEFELNRQPMRQKLDAVAFSLAVAASRCVHVVSNELIERFRAAHPRGKFVYNPNYVVDEYFQSRDSASSSQRINVVFLGDAGQAWQGIPLFIEQVIEGNDWFRDNAVLHIVGRENTGLSNMIQAKGLQELVLSHGFLGGDDKAGFMHGMDVGIGVFDLGAKGMTETTSIKMGEYLFAGLPVILGYEDNSLPAHSDFVLTLDLASDNDAAQRTNAFLKSVRENRQLHQKAHDYARDNLRVVNYVQRVLDAGSVAQ